MRPKNLKFPSTWEERRPMLHEGVFIVPQHYQEHDAWVDEEGLFSPDHSYSIEFCSGNGDWVIEKARANPKQSWIAVEMQFERVRKIWSKRENLGIENLLIVSGEALTFARHYLKEKTVAATFVNFPDPWPKPRHAKKRLIQPPFVEELSRVLCPGKRATYVTDDPAYRSQMIEVSLASSDWKSVHPDPFYTTSLDEYGHSWFRALWEEKGREIFCVQFERSST